MKSATAGDAQSRPILVSLFRYPLHEQEAMANTYPRTLAALASEVEIHHFCYREDRRHWLEDVPGFYLHAVGKGIKRGDERDKWRKTLAWYVHCIRIAWWARRRRARLVYVVETIPLLPLLLRVVSGRPIAMNTADIFWDVYLPDAGLGAWLKRWCIALDGAVFRGLRGLITHTEAFRRYAIAQRVDANRIRVVPEACEPEFFRPLDRRSCRERAGYADGETVIFFHGVFHPNKAIDRALEYVTPAMARHPSLRMVITGDGPMRPKLEAISRQLGIASRVEFTGWLPDVAALNVRLNAADISLVMREGRFSDRFQVTAALLHSLACGCTTLAARVDGVAELIDEGVNGLLFDPRSGREFDERVEALIRDPELRKRLGEAALETARTRLDPGNVAASWRAALRDFMGLSWKEDLT